MRLSDKIAKAADRILNEIAVWLYANVLKDICILDTEAVRLFSELLNIAMR